MKLSLSELVPAVVLEAAGMVFEKASVMAPRDYAGLEAALQDDIDKLNNSKPVDASQLGVLEQRAFESVRRSLDVR